MGLIVNILNTVAVEKLKHPDKKPINITNVKRVLYSAYNEYCLMMPGSTCDTGIYSDISTFFFIIILNSSEYAGLPASNSVSAKRLPYNLGVFITETVLDKLGADATETVLNFNIL